MARDRAHEVEVVSREVVRGPAKVDIAHPSLAEAHLRWKKFQDDHPDVDNWVGVSLPFLCRALP